jgi:nucleotide-binding universal stress UspA family protein
MYLPFPTLTVRGEPLGQPRTLPDQHSAVTVGIDLVPASATALAWAADIAAAHDVDLHLVHVCSGVSMPALDAAGAPAPARDPQEDGAWRLLADAARRARDAGARTTAHVRRGAIGNEIAHVASASGSSLVVIGAPRQGAAHVLRRATSGRACRLTSNSAWQVMVVR